MSSFFVRLMEWSRRNSSHQYITKKSTLAKTDLFMTPLIKTKTEDHRQLALKEQSLISASLMSLL